MAYTKNYDWIFDQIRAKNIVAYQLLDEGQKNTLAEGDDMTPDTVISELQTMLPHMGGMVYLVLSGKTKTEKAAGGAVGKNIKIPIQLGTGNAAAPVQGIGSTHGPGHYTQQQVDMLLQERDSRHQAEILRLQQEQVFNAKLQALEARLNDENRVNPYLEKFAPAINGILMQHFGAKPTMAVAGITDPPAAQDEPPSIDGTHPLQLQIEQDLDRLLAVDPDFPAALHGLADLAETNPDMYNMAKSMLPK